MLPLRPTDMIPGTDIERPHRPPRAYPPWRSLRDKARTAMLYHLANALDELRDATGYAGPAEYDELVPWIDEAIDKVEAAARFTGGHE